MCKILLFTPLVATLALAQSLSFGVKGGGLVVEPFETVTESHTEYKSLSKRYTVGPMVEIGLPFHLAIEVDALYKRFGSASSTINTSLASSYVRTSGNTWEFPVLLKYRFRKRHLRPFVSVGPNFRALVSAKELGQDRFLSSPTGAYTTILINDNDPPGLRRGNVGLTGAFGMEWRKGRLRVAPELRYTQWFYPLTSSSVTGVTSPFQHQAEVLLGISF